MIEKAADVAGICLNTHAFGLLVGLSTFNFSSLSYSMLYHDNNSSFFFLSLVLK